jgi:uncharacterized protein (DUF1501 family)
MTLKNSLCPDGATGSTITRRGALLGLTAAFTLGRVSLAFGNAATQNRFVVFLLRGALDGLSAVQPYGDPDFASLRGSLANGQPGAQDGVLDLGGFYGLHPSLQNLHTMYAANEVLIIHAAAGHYRSRSHFEAQDYLESGADQRLNSGWLNRAVATMAGAGSQDLALTMGLSAPLLLRGPAKVEAWAPAHFGGEPSDELIGRIMAVTQHDPLIGPALREGLKERGVQPAGASGARTAHEIVLASTAGEMLARPNGPRVAALEMGGWDTHAAQVGRLKNQLRQLDDALAALKQGLGPAWRQTVVLVVTEFGRTAHINGTGGTDHGTGGVAILAGGAVAGGKVRADWPGLGSGRLFENRDLQPTTDVRAVAKGVLAAHMGLDAGALERVFPGSGDAAGLGGLVRV